MSRVRAAVAAAVVVAAAGALACWLFLPHFLDPGPLAALLLAAGPLAVTAVLAPALALVRLRPGPTALALLAVLPVAVAAVVVALAAPPPLAGGGRAGPCLFAAALPALTAALGLAGARFAARAPLAAGIGTLVLVALGSTIVARLAQPRVDSVRVLLVGLDGTTWKLMKPLRRAGALPTVARLMREGAAGVLESEDPTLSPRVWTTMATGKSPERHAIIDFDTPQSALRAARVWEILEGEGRSIGVFGYLVTWPPGQHRGFLVPGWEARGPEATPPELSFVRYTPRSATEAMAMGAAFLRHGARVGSLVDAATAVVRYRGWTDAGYSAAIAFVQLALETDVFLHALRQHRPEFAAFVVSGSDTVSHLYWRHMDARHFPDVPAAERARFGDVISRYYREADRALARLLDGVAADAHTLVVSDHGNGPLVASRQALSIRAAALLAALDMPSDRVSVTTISGTAHFEARDAATRDGLRAKLDAVRWARSGTPVFETDLLSEAVVKARALKPAGGETTILVAGTPIPAEDIVHEGKFSGDHTRQGVLLAVGPRVRAGARIRGARIRDVTPTVLALFDLPPADDMQGRVLAELFTEPPRIARRVPSWDHHLPRFDDGRPPVSNDVQDRLKALGYL